MVAELHEHQEVALAKMHNGCVLTGDVGTGKTITALAYALRKEPGRVVYVITTAKVRDAGSWQHEAAKLAFPVDKLVVDSWNNISKYTDKTNSLFIFDEQRLVGTGAWVKSFYEIARLNRWILLSATPGDTWLDYAPVFIANRFYKNITQFRDEHVEYARFVKYPMVKRYHKTDILQRRLKLILVEMPMKRHTVRHIEEIECDYDKDKFLTLWKHRWNIFDDEPVKDAGELFRLGRKLVHQHPSRVEALKTLMRKHRRLIVFYNFDYELEILRKTGEEWNEGLETTIWNTQFAEWNGHKHEKVPECESWVYLVQYMAGSEGWNCTETDAMAFYSLTYSYKQFKQAQGRIDRMNTKFTDLYYYVLSTRSIVHRAVWRALQNKRDFNVRAFSKG